MNGMYRKVQKKSGMIGYQKSIEIYAGNETEDDVKIIPFERMPKSHDGKSHSQSGTHARDGLRIGLGKSH